MNVIEHARVATTAKTALAGVRLLAAGTCIRRAVILVCLPACTCLLTTKAQSASFLILDTTDPSYWPSDSVAIRDISADGSTIAGSYLYGEVGARLTAARWNAEGEGLRSPGLGPTETTVGSGAMLGPPPVEAIASGISANGSVVVGHVYDRSPSGMVIGTAAFRWTAQGGVVLLGTLGGEGSSSTASDVSGDGSVVVGSSASQAFRWTPTQGMIGLGQLQGHATSFAAAVSADGLAIVGASSSNAAAEAFRWTQQDGMVGLGRLPNRNDSYALACSADGSVVVGWSGTGVHEGPYPLAGVPGDEAFLWTESEGLTGLGFLPGHAWSQAYAVSADGSMVVGSSAAIVDGGVGTRQGFLWDAQHGMRNLKDLLAEQYGLDVPDWPLGAPAGISADGRVIIGDDGNWPSPGGVWIATVPEPSTFALLAIAAAGRLGYSRWRWRVAGRSPC